MSKSDRAELRRRRNKLCCPQTLGEISHIARGDRDSATTFAGVLDPLRSVIGSATFRHRIGQRLQSRRGHQIRMRRDRPIRQLDRAAVSALSSRVKATLIVSDFPFSRRSLPREAMVRGRAHTRIAATLEDWPEGNRLALSPAFSTREIRARLDLRRDRRPELKSPAAARAAGARLLAGRRLERGLQIRVASRSSSAALTASIRSEISVVFGVKAASLDIALSGAHGCR